MEEAAFAFRSRMQDFRRGKSPQMQRIPFSAFEMEIIARLGSVMMRIGENTPQSLEPSNNL